MASCGGRGRGRQFGTGKPIGCPSRFTCVLMFVRLTMTGLLCQKARSGSTHRRDDDPNRGSSMVHVREAQLADLEAILAIYNDAVIHTTATYDYEPRRMDAQRQWFEAKRAQDFPVLVGLEAGVGIGVRKLRSLPPVGRVSLHGRELDLRRARTARPRGRHGDSGSA